MLMFFSPDSDVLLLVMANLVERYLYFNDIWDSASGTNLDSSRCRSCKVFTSISCIHSSSQHQALFWNRKGHMVQHLLESRWLCPQCSKKSEKDQLSTLAKFVCAAYLPKKVHIVVGSKADKCYPSSGKGVHTCLESVLCFLPQHWQELFPHNSPAYS